MTISDWFSAMMRGDQIPVALAALTVVVAVAAVWFGLVEHNPVDARLRGLAKVRDELRAGVEVVRRNRTRTDFRQSAINVMSYSVTRFNLMRGRQIERITFMLGRAGWRSQDAATAYLFIKAFLPMVVIVAAMIFMLLRTEFDLSVMQIGFIFLPLAFIGLSGVDLVLRMIGDRRVLKLTKAMPDALDLLVICTEAGLSLDSAFKRVGEEMAHAAPEMSDELLLTALELNYLPDRHKALRNLSDRTDMSKLRSLVNSLIQAERYGTPIANSLRVLSNEFRDERLIRAEEKAAKLPAIMTVPLIMFVLPSLFMIIMGPAIIRVMDALKH
jgi:tight adherence protein C